MTGTIMVKVPTSVLAGTRKEGTVADIATLGVRRASVGSQLPNRGSTALAKRCP